MAECNDGSCALPPRTRSEKRAEFERDATKAPDIHRGLRDELVSIGHHWFVHEATIAEVEEHLHDAWDELIHAARLIPSDSAEQDRLVALVLELREFGSLTHSNSDASRDSSKRVEAAVVSTGQHLWTDLPVLAQELQDAWTVELTGFDVAERRNLAALTARLCAVGVCEAATASCSLWLLAATLERDDKDGDAGSGLNQLLPACLAWLHHGAFKLARLCAANYSPAASAAHALAVQPGPLAVRANVAAPDFSMGRWLFWRHRLGQLYLDGAQPVAQLARECFELMVGVGLPLGLDVPGERRYLERVFKALSDEMVARGSTESVGVEDIRIDPAWADE